MNKKRIISHISALTLLAFSFQVIVLLQAARAELPCWNDGSIGYANGGTLPEKPPTEDKNQPKDADPVNLSNGNYHYQNGDISIAGRNIYFGLMRTYNNQDNYDGPFGYGWNHNYNIFLTEVSDSVNNYMVRRNGYGNIDRFRDNGDGTYTSPYGVYDTLTKEAGLYVITDKHGTKYKFNANNKLTQIVGPNNNQMSFSYNGVGQLEIVTDSCGRQITFYYNPNKKIDHITDFAGRNTSYGYTNGNLTSVTTPPTNEYPSGLTTIYTYHDGTNNMKNITDAKGQIYISLTYDSFDRVETQKYGEGTFYFSYDAQQKITHLTDRKGHQTEWQFNDGGTPLRKKEYTYGLRTGEPPYYETVYIYNSNKELEEISYPRGNRIKYTYDNKGNVLEIRRKSHLGEADIVTTFTYEPRYNFVKTMTDPRLNITTYTYDYEDVGYITETGNLMKVTYPSVGGQTIETEFTYNSYGQIETVTDPNGNVIKYEYYPITGYLKKLITGYGVLNYTAEMSYNDVGNVTSIKDPRGNITTFIYNTLNQLEKAISAAPFSYETKYFYDENGNLRQIDRQTDDPLNSWQTTAYTYTILDGLKSITDDLGHTTRLDYDLNENKSSITDAENNVTKYVYDERDLLWKIIQANEGIEYITECSYDYNGNLKEIKDSCGNNTTYQYDGFDRLKITTYDDLTTESYTYDNANNLETKTNQKNQIVTYDYDELNRLDLKTYPDLTTIDYVYDVGSRLIDIIDANGTIHYDYDEVNKIEQVTYPGSIIIGYQYYQNGDRKQLTYPDSSYVTYWYDELNRLTDIKDAASQVIAHYDYDALSRREKLTLLTGTEVVYGYDAINRLANITNRTASLATISSFSYPTYDNVGNRKTMIANGTDTHSYAYDDIYQLTNVVYPNSSSITYDYDKAGNRLSVINGGTTAYISNDMNQYDSIGGVTYTYDDNGNLTNDGTNSYSYDYENRLISATTPSHTVTYTSDGFDRRIRKEVDSNITKYIYDGDQIIAERDGAGATIAKYIYGPGIDEPISIEKSGETYYYSFDGLGSVTNLTNSSGMVVESYMHDVYGRPDVTSAIGNIYFFTGRQYDVETELYYYRARNYDAKMGRFLQVDPIGYDADLNLYRYCYNNPINYIDPFGYVDIYINRGGRGSGKGHTAIGFGDDPSDTYGFWPNPARRPIDPRNHPEDLVKNHPGIVRNPDPMTRDPRGYDDKITIPTTPEQDQKMRDYIEKRKKNPGSWNLPFNNCTDFVDDVLLEGGMDVNPGDLFSSPRTLSNNLRERDTGH